MSKTQRSRTLKPEAAEPMGWIEGRLVGGERQRRLHLSRGLLALALALFVLGCEKEQAGTQAGTPPEVLVIEVPQQDVELFSRVGRHHDRLRERRDLSQGPGLPARADSTATADVVKQGQVLFEIDPRQFEAALDRRHGQLQTAEAVLEQDRDRRRALYAAGREGSREPAGTRQRDPGARCRTARSSSAQADVQQARLNLDWTKVTLADRRHCGDRHGADRRPRGRTHRCSRRSRSSTRSRSASRSARSST